MALYDSSRLMPITEGEQGKEYVTFVDRFANDRIVARIKWDESLRVAWEILFLHGDDHREEVALLGSKIGVG